MQQQRVAARDLVAGRAERVFCHCCEVRAQELRHRVRAQRRRPDDGGERISHDLGQKRGILTRLALPDARDDHELELFDPRHQVGEPAQRRQVAPVQVVDHEQEGLLGGDVHGQPVEPVKHPERNLRRRAGELTRLEQRARKLRGAREGICAFPLRELDHERLEQLSHDAERERAFELGAACAERLEPRGLAPPPRLGEQRRLADSGRSLDRQQASDATDERIDGRQLTIAFEQDGLPASKSRLGLYGASLLSRAHGVKGSISSAIALLSPSAGGAGHTV